MYYKSATDAVEAALIETEKRGYIVDENDFSTQITYGGRYGRARPPIGKTHSFILSLSKGKKAVKESLTITLYGMASGNYELVNYIN